MKDAKIGKPDVIYHSMLNVPIETCIERDKQRENPVGEEVIKKMDNNLYGKFK